MYVVVDPAPAWGAARQIKSNAEKRWRIQFGTPIGVPTGGCLVLIFAEAASHCRAWKQALEGWNVQTSQQVMEWQAEALLRQG
jgi:hypothetical protein